MSNDAHENVLPHLGYTPGLLDGAYSTPRSGGAVNAEFGRRKRFPGGPVSVPGTGEAPMPVGIGEAGRH